MSIMRNTGQPAPQRVSNYSLYAALHDPQRTLRIVILPHERVLVVGVGRRPVGASVLSGDCSRHDRAVVCMNDLTHLLSLEADAALLGAAPPDELADGEEDSGDDSRVLLGQDGLLRLVEKSPVIPANVTGEQGVS